MASQYLIKQSPCPSWQVMHFIVLTHTHTHSNSLFHMPHIVITCGNVACGFFHKLRWNMVTQPPRKNDDRLCVCVCECVRVCSYQSKAHFHIPGLISWFDPVMSFGRSRLDKIKLDCKAVGHMHIIYNAALPLNIKVISLKQNSDIAYSANVRKHANSCSSIALAFTHLSIQNTCAVKQ